MKLYMPCGHPIGCLFRFPIGKTVKKYCLGCVFDKLGLPEITEEQLCNCTNTSKLDISNKTETNEKQKVNKLIKQ